MCCVVVLYCIVLYCGVYFLCSMNSNETCTIYDALLPSLLMIVTVHVQLSYMVFAVSDGNFETISVMFKWDAGSFHTSDS